VKKQELIGRFPGKEGAAQEVKKLAAISPLRKVSPMALLLCLLGVYGCAQEGKRDLVI